MRAMLRRWASALAMAVLVLLVLAWHGIGEWSPATLEQPGEPIAHAAPAEPVTPVGGTAAVHDALHGGTALVPVTSSQTAPGHADVSHAGPADCPAAAPTCWTGHPTPDLPAPAPVPDVVLPLPPAMAALRADRWSAAPPRAPDLSELSVLRI
ncbi:hypothetical protein KIK06_22845 [Nocardiopsis sp. EMB25]|uniref:hypothetical protein n=1 Tax=Nocardiopsis TaxID=2013 RepID=UPI00034CF458|nr:MULTISPECIES: hypothetical protein [Nocardiopsis]MCY9786727.1 hypothetical protein [Nocardiopsis sp. EMB25]